MASPSESWKSREGENSPGAGESGEAGAHGHPAGFPRLVVATHKALESQARFDKGEGSSGCVRLVAVMPWCLVFPPRPPWTSSSLLPVILPKPPSGCVTSPRAPGTFPGREWI